MIPRFLPFHYKSHDRPGNGKFPEVLPFNVYFDERYKMFRQHSSPELRRILSEVYEEGSLADGSISNESGNIYVNRVSDYIQRHLPSLQSKDVLEVGCGSGIILKSLKNTGANLTGVDPGLHKLVDGLDNIRIVRDFFPSSSIPGQFDVILHFFILEHIEDFRSFLNSQVQQLKEGGKIIFGVPNCEPFLNSGDISIFIHEHYNYFTSESISIIVAEAGLCLENIDVIEGMLIATVSQRNSQSEQLLKFRFDQDDFFIKAEQWKAKVNSLFESYPEDEIAVYVPARALNLLYTINRKRVRLIDDNRELHGKYFPYFIHPIESFSDLERMPAACVLIYSQTFGERIRKKCALSSSLTTSQIFTLPELLGETFSFS